MTAKINFQNRKNVFLSATRVLTMTLFIGLITVSCGKDDDNGDDNNGNGNDTELTAANWQKVIKDVYDFDLTVPTGWTFKQGKKENTNPAYSVQFTSTAADFKAEYSKFMQHLFDLTEKITPAKGNYNEDGEQLNEIPDIMGIPMPLWLFDTPKYAIQVDLMDAETTKTVQIYLVALKSL